MPTLYATGGQSTDCAVFGRSATEYTSFRISNPQTGGDYRGRLMVAGAPTGAPFKINLEVVGQGQRKDKFFSFTIIDPDNPTGPSRVAAADVGVKGGTETARYRYEG